MSNTAYPFEESDGVVSLLGQRLRTVGQGLESLDVEDFELRVEGDGYFALGIPRALPKSDAADNSVNQARVSSVLRKAWHNLVGRNSAGSKFSTPGSNVLRILFTAEGLVRLEHKGRAKRNDDSSGIPNPNKLPQMLRLVGECIDEKSGRFIAVEKRRDRISFEYVIDSNNHVHEEWKLADLYEFWFDISKRRQARYGVAERTLANELETPRSEPESRILPR
jgi:hypothetical protein